MTEHAWIVEEIDAGTVVGKFWICRTCGSSGGPTSYGDGKPGSLMGVFLAGSSLRDLPDDCDEAKRIIDELVDRYPAYRREVGKLRGQSEAVPVEMADIKSNPVISRYDESIRELEAKELEQMQLFNDLIKKGGLNMIDHYEWLSKRVDQAYQLMNSVSPIPEYSAEIAPLHVRPVPGYMFIRPTEFIGVAAALAYARAQLYRAQRIQLETHQSVA